MNNRFASRILTAMLVLTLTLCVCATAFAELEKWICPACQQVNTGKFCVNCGAAKPLPTLLCGKCGFTADASTDYKFCPECGNRLNGVTEATGTPAPTQMPTVKPTQKPTATPKPRAFSITDVSENDDGTVTIRWQDSDNNGPYDVDYEHYVSGSYYSTEQSARLRWTGNTGVSGKYTTIEWLTPGDPYWIVVTDAAGNSVREAYIPDKPARFREFGVDISMDFKVRTGTKTEDISRFSASDITKNNGTYEYGAYIKLTYPQLAKSRSYLGHIALRLPDGTSLTRVYDPFDLPNGRSYTYWNFFSFEWYLSEIIKQYDSIPSGEYTWELFFDGLLVNVYSFRIGT